MTRKTTRVLFLFLFLLLILFVVAAVAWRQQAALQGFAEYPLPVSRSYRLFDIGVTDVDNDGWADIYTSNHHFRQVLLMADGKGGYVDRLSDFGLDQATEFPRAELAFGDPAFDKPGLYLFWFGTNFVLYSKGLEHPERFRGTLRAHDWIRTRINSGFKVDIRQQVDKVSETRVSFVPPAEGRLVLDLGGQGLPLVFDFEGAIDPAMIFVGHGKVSPASPHFSLAMQDRHALAWSDYDGDGRKDVFIDRGALGGRLRAYPEKIIQAIHDELLVSAGDERYSDISAEAGFDKNGCSGRHARWVDFDGDGRLDLFINCYNRHNVMTIGDYPKQLYRQGEDGRFTDVAPAVGLGVPDIQFGSLEFVDLDHDGDQDYIAVTDQGVVIFRNHGGHFRKEIAFRREKVEGVKVGDTTGDRWLFDGKLTVADYESDGDLDFFVGSKRGNVLLRNDKGTLTPVAMESVGLPASSMAANWVDYDNDGRVDLHLVPQGLYRQGRDGRFEATGVLAWPPGKYRAAIGNWADLDNDGRMDALLALSKDPNYTSWKEELLGKKKERPHWEIRAYRNTNSPNHWLEVELSGPAGNAEGIGARVTVTTPAGSQTRQVGATDGAFFSQGNYRLHFGLGKHQRVDELKVEWPDGKIQVQQGLEADRLLRLGRG